MRQQNKALILIISIFFLFTIQIIAFIPIPVVGNSNDYFIIPEGNTISYDWLTITMEEDDNDYLCHNIGGIDLIDYQSLGSSEAGVDNKLIFMSRIKFGYEINSYLVLSLRDVFPDLRTDMMSSFTTYATIKLTTLTTTEMHYGKFRYNYVSLGTPNYHDHSANILMTIGINPTFSALDGKLIGGVPIKTSEYLHEVKTVKVVSAHDGTCGDYSDYYTGKDEVSGGVITETFSKSLTLSQEAVINRIESMDLGWETGNTPEYVTSGITIQQSLLNAPAIGVAPTNPETGNLNYRYPLRMAPEITYTKQRIDVKTGGFNYNEFFGTFPPQFPPFPTASYSIDRIISGHVRCPFVHQEYEAIVYLLCSVELDAEIYESALQDPYFVKGDWLWDPIIDSWDPVITVPPTIWDELEDWWDKYGWIIITIIVLTAGIYIFIQVGMPLILLKKQI